METSSPLAAMHRPTAAPFGKCDLFTNFRVRLSPGKPRGGRSGLGVGALGSSAAGYSIRDQLNQDCFGPVHGSSPAGSLAADLCQNFTIGDDASPRFPTPRRALFTSSAKNRSFVKAPPLPVSSSPLPIESLMEMTPVPARKKAALAVAMATDSPLTSSSLPVSPCPAAPAEPDEMILESPSPQKHTQPPRSVSAQLAQLTQSAQPHLSAQESSRLLTSGLERRKFPRRASLTRAKGYSFAGPSGRFHADSQLPFFRFGESRVSAVPAVASMFISDCSQESPVPTPAAAGPECRPQSSHSPCPSGSSSGTGPIRSRPSFVSASSAGSASSSRTGSPVPSIGHGPGHIRRPSSSFVRPRRQYRRSLSMFDNAGDIMKPKREEHAATLEPTMTATTAALKPSLLASVMDTDDESSVSRNQVLPHFFPEGQNDSIPRISRSTLLRVLDGQFGDRFDRTLLIDCRFEYEYDGGHINEAINYNDKDLLANHLFQNPSQGRTLVVLHCEYSAHRAPLMARHIRAEDRAANAEHYPRLTYPELYILDGGYSGFFGEHPNRCFPQAYVEMDAAEHAFTCEREMGRLRQNRKGLHRAQTFAFGQQASRPTNGVESSEPQQEGGQEQASSSGHYLLSQFSSLASPSTARCRASFGAGASSSTTSSAQPDSPSPSVLMGGSPIIGLDRRHARRMVSY